MFSISRKVKENISLTVSIACLLISALWLIFYMTFDPHTNLSDVSAFHFLMWFSSVLFGGLIGVCIVPAVTAIVGFFSAANYFHSDRPALRVVSRVVLISQGVLTVATAVVILITFA